MDKAFTSYQIAERSFVAYIKREIHNQATRCRFSDIQVAEIDIIVSEMCSNLIKHAGSGELLYRFNDVDDNSIFEIIAIDRGEGIYDTARMMKDGVSTTKTLGQGLGAIKRLSDHSQLYSIPKWGTIHYSKVTAKPEEDKTMPKPEFDVDIRALCVNKPRETVCGDGYCVKRTPTDVMILFADGLGHGQHAKDAVDRAGEFFLGTDETGPVEIIRGMHEHVRRTRGLVATVAVCSRKTNEWRVCGVGNIGTRLYGGILYKNYMSYNGTIGLNIPTSMNPSVFPVEKNQHLIMCSDGIQTRWDLARYPSILKYDTTILASAIYKDYSRGNDDSSILVVKVI